MKRFIKKKIIYFFILIIIIFIVSAYFLMGKGYFSVVNKIFTTQQIQNIKEYIFPYKVIIEQKKTLADLDSRRKKTFSYLFELELKSKKNLDDIQIRKSEYIKLSNNKTMSKFTIGSGFYSAIYKINPGGYIDFYENNLFLISSRGILAYGQNLEDKNLKKIENNLNDFINLKQFNKSITFSLRDLLIYKNKIFISYIEEVKEDCYNTNFVYGDLDFDKIKFKKASFNKTNDCIHFSNNIDNEFNGMQSGGRIVHYDDNHVLFSVGEFRNRFLAQEKENINGKVIKVNIENFSYEIISMGHRNPQGLYYDKKNNFIIETEHGPMGGDEINLIEISKINKEKPLNYGWAIVSAGEHYKGKVKDNKEKYRKYPLYKSHTKYGFVEPLKSFVPSIGISEVTKIGNNKFVVSSMKDKSLYFFELDNKKEIQNLERVEVFERVRDLKFHNDKLYLFLEEPASIGVISFN